jgi:drug/metabolite transporter (DMT)-like permease
MSVVAESAAMPWVAPGTPEITGRKGDPVAYVFLVAMVLIGSSTATAVKYVVREVPVGLIPLVRFGLAGLVLLPIVWRSEAFRRMIRDDLPRLALTAACCVPINQTFFLNGTKLVPTTHVALIYAAVPLVVLVLATAIGQERLTIGRLFSVLASVVGLCVIAVGNLNDTSADGRDYLLGDFILIGAVISWGAYLTVSKPLIARYGSLPVLTATFLAGSLLDLPIAAWTYRSWPPLAGISTRSWVALGYLTLIVTILGLLFQNLSLRRLDASHVATFGNLSPLLTIVWGHLLLGERITPMLAVGGALILLGVFGMNPPIRRRRVVPSGSVGASVP